MSDPTAGFLEGLVSGGAAGYSFREGVKDRKRRRAIEDALLSIKMAEANRQQREGQIKEALVQDQTGLAVVPSSAPQIPFNPPAFGAQPAQPADRVGGLRRAVGSELAGPSVDFSPEGPGAVRGSFGRPRLPTPTIKQGIHYGGVEEVGTPRAVREELGYDPSVSTGSLEGDIARARQPTVAQSVGHALAGFSGRTGLSPAEEILVGRGKIPYGALAPKPYHATTRAEFLENAKALIGARTSQRQPITMDQALKAVDRIYGVWNEATQQLTFPTLSPAARVALAQKMVSGKATEKDFPAVTPDLEQAPSGPKQPSKPGAISRAWQWMFGGGDGSGEGSGAAGAAAPDRFKEARDILNDPRYQGLSDDAMRAALREAGYEDDEIDEILSGGTEGP